MPVPKRRRSRARRDRQRTHKKLAAPQIAKCENCGAPRQPHRICPECGQYKGRTYKTVVTS